MSGYYTNEETEEPCEHPRTALCRFGAVSLNANHIICKCCAGARESSLFTGFIGSARATYCLSTACRHGYTASGVQLVTKNSGCAGRRQRRQA